MDPKSSQIEKASENLGTKNKCKTKRPQKLQKYENDAKWFPKGE